MKLLRITDIIFNVFSTQTSLTSIKITPRHCVLLPSMSTMNERMIHKIIETLPLSWFHHRLVILCGLSFMADSMEVSLLSFLSTCAGDLSSFPQSIYISSIELIKSSNIQETNFSYQILREQYW